MMQGYNLEDITPGVDETLIRQPLGVVAAIVPFNFPAMIPFWFLPYAIACGNTFVFKPSERVPLTVRRTTELIEKTGIPKGVVNIVNGGGKTCVPAVGGRGKADAVPGGRKKSRDRVAGCGHGSGEADYQRLGVWLRGAAVPGGFRRRDDWRGAKDVSRCNCGSGFFH